MTRVALYARYSSDNQREASIEDQLRICREQAKREKWKIIGTYKDAGISGASMILRPGIQALLQDAQAGQFDIVLAEALDRISRDQADVATFYKHLKFAGVPIVTLSEGEISELHVGLKGTMNALFLKDLAAKTHRGIRGRVEDGKSGGGLCFGYNVVKQLDARGDPIRGDREINEAEASVVRRIFREFAAGVGPRTIARTLNEEGIPGPAGKLWSDTTIRGHVKRGTGLVNNELYIGRLIWNRLRYIKDPSTGRRVSRLNPESVWIIKDVPELRIVDDELWHSVRVRQGEIAEKFANVTEAVRKHHKKNRLNGTRRPKSLLSGLVFCGCCGGPYSLRGADRFACSNHISKGACSNSRTIPREELEARVLSGLKDRMMAPEIVEEAMRAYAEETNRLNRERRSSGDAWKAELVKIEKQSRGIIEAIKAGMFHESMKAEMDTLEARKTELNTLLADAPEDTPDILPSASAIYAKKVSALTKALNRKQERQEAAEILRGLIEKISLTPGPERGEIYATLHGEFSTILNWTERQAIGKVAKTTKPATDATVLSLSVVAGARSNLHLRPEQVKMVAGTGVDHNLRSTPVKMVAGGRTHHNLLFRAAA
ncbi:recombinase family protein [Pseudochelatococcus contaminans]|uniref:recombinase family protein n=1 Tax=Pseudochelatococcus contaminans TaxID=1538103 RepID=UPI00160E8901|nr:recombinase family protein [Pseudochelatococcus contaminans]